MPKNGKKMKAIFGVRPTSFRNTELMYNNDVANVVADMGYRSILCEQRDDMYMPKEGESISPNAVFRAKGRNGRARSLLVLPRNRNLSDDIAFRFPHMHITAEDYAASIGRVDGEAVLLGYDYEHIGEHMWADTGIFDFWRSLGHALTAHPNIVLANPSEIAERFEEAECPMVDIHPLATSTWADKNRDTYGWLGSATQHTLFQDIQSLEKGARTAGHVFYKKWRNLTTSDHLYYLHEGREAPYTSALARTVPLPRPRIY